MGRVIAVCISKEKGTQNIYAPFAGKEVTLEQKPQEIKKPDTGR